MRVHLDTDVGDNPDDLCALSLLLGRPDVVISAITTSSDEAGERRERLARFLALAGREEVRTASGGSAEAVAALERSVRSGAHLLATGPLTNLAALLRERPGALDGVRLTYVGGWIDHPGPGWPAWGSERDTNTRRDPEALLAVWGTRALLTLVPLTAAAGAALRGGHLARLAASGRLGRLLAAQSAAHRTRRGYAVLAREHPALPNDLVNFLFDPVGAAVALGWPGARVEQRSLRPVLERGLLRLEPSAAGRRTGVLCRLDAAAFVESWLEAVSAADRLSGGGAARTAGSAT